MLEVLRFAEEFDALDGEHYSAVTFADWLALSVAADGHGRGRVRLVRD
jgi:hypothetical protein